MKRIAALLGLLHGLVLALMASPTDQTVFSPVPDSFVRPESTLPTLADLLTLEARASIFYAYARDTNLSARFSQDGGTTLFVPTNKAVQALARKPHEDPAPGDVSAAALEAISNANVQRWVGAHIVPRPGVDFMATAPYDTLTPGTTVTFRPVPTARPDASTPDTDAAHLAAVKGRVSPKQCRARWADTDAAHRAAVKGPDGRAVVDTDAAHFASVRRPASPGRHHTSVGAAQLESAVHTPWKQYELNDGVRIIAERKASNGVMYLIDGTVLV